MSEYLTRELGLTVPDDGAGPRLGAIVYVPRDAAAGRRRAPLVVCCHGMNESGLRVAPVAQRLAMAGAVAICPSFRGGGAPTAGPTTAMSVLTELADLGAVLEAASAWPFVDPARVALVGRSQGGLVALLAASRRATSVTALALWYPALELPDGVRARFRTREAVPATFAHRVDGRDVVLGRRYAQDAWDLDVWAESRRFRGPVLLVHGDRDADVPIAVSRRAVRVLPDARLVEVPGAAHGFAGSQYDLALQRTVDHLAWAGVLPA